MNGPEHYKEAERLLTGVWVGPPERYTMDERALFAALAQVHATLALAAAQVDCAPEIDTHVDAWIEATE